MKIFSAWLLAASATLTACADVAGGPPMPSAPREFTVAADAVRESSGLARSHRAPGIFWTHNDSRNSAEAFAIDEGGGFAGTLVVSGVPNVDWEDVASFVDRGVPRLLFADIGDNRASRTSVTLHIVDEPDFASHERPFRLKVTPVRSIELQYPDGARDAESVFVDPREAAIYLLSKRDDVPRLYRVPLAPATREVTAEALGDIAVPRATPRDRKPKRINWVTSMDVDDAGTRLVLVTMARAHLYPRNAGEPWTTALRRAPRTYGLPDYDQIEGVAFTPDGSAIAVISEGSPAPFALLPLP
jgi:hypothetical protein